MILFNAAACTVSTEGRMADGSDVSSILEEREVPPSKKRVARPGRRVWWARVASRAAARAVEMDVVGRVWGEDLGEGSVLEGGGGEDVGLDFAMM